MFFIALLVKYPYLLPAVLTRYLQEVTHTGYSKSKLSAAFSADYWEFPRKKNSTVSFPISDNMFDKVAKHKVTLLLTTLINDSIMNASTLMS